MFTGPNIVRDGLVLHLDAANEKSFRGEPTVNLVNNTPTQNGWSGTYTVIDSDTKTFTFETRQDNAATTSAWRTWYWSVSSYIGQTVTISAKVKHISETNATFRDITIGQGNTGAFPYHIAGSDAIDRVTISTKPVNEITMSWTGVINATGVVGFTQWINNVTANGGNSIIQVSNIQIEAKPYATPFVNGTRGSTVATGGGWADKSGNNNHGTLVNGPTYSSANNGSIVFNGSNTNILLSNPTSFAGPYTILLWAKPTTALVPGGSGANKPTGANRKTLFVGPGPTWNPGIWITSDYIRSHADTQYIDSAINWNTASWKMIGMTYNGTNCQNIFNGEILPVAFTTGYAPPNPTQLLIGAETSAGNGQNWNGNVSLFSVYNRVLTSDEIREVYNATKSRFGL